MNLARLENNGLLEMLYFTDIKGLRALVNYVFMISTS